MNYTVTLVNGKGNVVTHNNLLTGSYFIDMKYSGDDYYLGSTKSTSFTVKDKEVSELEFNIPVILVNESSVIPIGSNFDNGELIVYIDGKLQNQKVLIPSNLSSRLMFSDKIFAREGIISLLIKSPSPFILPAI